MSTSVWLWAGFAGFILSFLALDLGVFHRRPHEVQMKEALTWSATWVTLALGFNGLIYFRRGGDRALEFLTGYLVELSLSLDNLFVFLLIFAYFGVPARYQHKVLFWGILGALFMRGVFIAGGVALINRVHWIIYLFGGVLVVSGIRLLFRHNKEVRPEKDPVLMLFHRCMAVTPDYREGRFFVRERGRTLATPLVVVLVMLETTDLVFAIDSVPAVLAITTDPFIVYSSNAFAILGLRSMFFALAGVIRRFVYLQYSLAAVLVFVGAKMLVSSVCKIPTLASLLVIALLLAVGLTTSLVCASSAGVCRKAAPNRLDG